jgi:hypothetical protein
MKSINCVVRLENGKPIMFWYEEYLRVNKYYVLECYTLADGYNTATEAYMRSLKPCPSELASEFVSRYNYHYCDDSQPSMKLCKRLVKPKI